ncbi:hypothetical protein WJX72_003581 [[Myrmecia] bisecta]|uniref:Beta-galactosidase n=1 Tax=[Myrmecia] bisecta TaxID=41462 RepID=A0AAW1Q5W8_9CHLO
MGASASRSRPKPTISVLNDEMLQEVFSHLPIVERQTLVPLVCKPRLTVLEVTVSEETSNAPFPQNVVHLKHLQRLLLYGAVHLGPVPDGIWQLCDLKMLDMQSRPMLWWGGEPEDAEDDLVLPDSRCYMQHLENLTVNGQSLQAFPRLEATMGLQTLDLSTNQLTTLPDDLDRLPHVTKLTLSLNKLTELPGSLGGMEGLEELKLGDNQMTTLPAGMGQLSALTALSVERNCLTEVPSSITHMTNLEDLYMRSLRLEAMPAFIGGLTALCSLDMAGNAIQSLPDSLSSLVHLVELDCMDNKLTELPAGIGRLTALRKLSLPHNALRMLPTGFGLLSSLVALDISHNELAAFPASFSLLTQLQTLNLGFNRSMQLHCQELHLPSLESLDVSCCSLKSVPDWVAGLTCLKKLTLQVNFLTALPEGPYLRLAGPLSELCVIQNPFLEFPRVVRHASNLYRLNMSGCKRLLLFKEDESMILNHMPSLRHLDLWGVDMWELSRPGKAAQLAALEQWAGRPLGNLPALISALNQRCDADRQACWEQNGQDFSFNDDKFMIDGQALQIISGSLHYNRIHPTYWQDRLARARSMGLNAIQTYVPWNLHEPYMGEYRWSGFADLEGFLRIAQETGLLVILRPGPYICAEMDWGGLPSWLASSAIAGGRSMKLRSSDPVYLAHVDRWWSVLLPKMAQYMYYNGGPIVMVQVENEYGFFGPDPDYIRHLAALAKSALGDEAVIFTTDPPSIIANGTLAGDQVYSVVDFPPGTNVSWAFQAQASFNPKGQSPPYCSEFYTGWLTHWGEKMANTSAEALISTFKEILAFGNNSGSVDFYMAHGGTSWGFQSGGGMSGSTYRPQLTSYDYDAPISEAGDVGQPGIGGPNKFEMIRGAIEEHTGVEPPPRLPPPRIAGLGTVSLQDSASLLAALPTLYAGDGICGTHPINMEDLGQRHGVTVYRTWLPAGLLRESAVLDLAAPVHDYAHVLLNGKVGQVQLDIVVHAMGRDSTASFFDNKGLVAPDVRINGMVHTGWRLFPLELDIPGDLQPGDDGPVFVRGSVHVGAGLLEGHEHPPDTFIDLTGWGKGLAWINDFNLGWYWPSIGPQMTHYIPGPVLREGANEVVLLEFERLPKGQQVTFTVRPNFSGPEGKIHATHGITAAPDMQEHL